MNALHSAKTLIRESFALVPYPGDDNLRGSNEGTEPFWAEAEFLGRNDWSVLSAEFIDQSPGGLGSALSFFSDAAFRYYIPAYMLADLDGMLERANPLFQLTYGLDDAYKDELVNPKRYGAMTWFNYAQARFSSFDQAQRRAVAAYLECKKSSDELFDDDKKSIEQAIKRFWLCDAA